MLGTLGAVTGGFSLRYYEQPFRLSYYIGICPNSLWYLGLCLQTQEVRLIFLWVFLCIGGWKVD